MSGALRADAHALKKAVLLYRGDLLEGCYEDWCVYERERIKAMYLAALEKLLEYCEVRGQPAQGFAYGERLLRHEPAHERAHWRLMRLYWLAGDRTGALRQYERCRDALRGELGIEPGERIRGLRDRLRAELPMTPQRHPDHRSWPLAGPPATVRVRGEGQNLSDSGGTQPSSLLDQLRDVLH